MNALWGYLVIGVVVSVGALATGARPFAEWIHDYEPILDGWGAPAPTRAQRVWRRIGIPLVRGLLTTLAWPIVLVREVRSRLRMRATRWTMDETFVVKLQSLREPMTVQAIEARERVVDPLGAVPDLPFGHLHPAWCKLRDGRLPGDALWSFAEQWHEKRFDAELLEGYVVVRRRRTVDYVLTRCEWLAEP